MYKLVGVLGLITFVVCVICSINVINERSTNEIKVVVATQESCIDRLDNLFNDCADLDMSDIDDLRSEQMLVVDPARAPEALVQGLLEAGTWLSDDVSGTDRMLVPVGTHVDAPGAMYVATGEGWLGCEDGITAAECSGATLAPVAAS